MCWRARGDWTICVETLELKMPSRHGVSMWTCENLFTFYAMPMKFLLFSQNLSILCTVGFRPHKFHFQLKHTKDFTHSTPLELRQILPTRGWENGKVNGKEAAAAAAAAVVTMWKLKRMLVVRSLATILHVSHMWALTIYEMQCNTIQ